MHWNATPRIPISMTVNMRPAALEKGTLVSSQNEVISLAA